MGCSSFCPKDVCNGFVLPDFKEYSVRADPSAPYALLTLDFFNVAFVWIKSGILYGQENPFRIRFGEAAERFIDRCVNLDAPVFA